MLISSRAAIPLQLLAKMRLSILRSVALLSIASVASALPSSQSSSTSCTFNDYQHFKSSKDSCSSIVINSMAVPAGETLDFTFAKGNGVSIDIRGPITFGYKEWTGPLVRFQGSHLHVTSSSGGQFNGQGQRWWDGKGGNGGKAKPKFIVIQSSSSTFKGLRVVDSPVHTFAIRSSNDVRLQDISITNANGEARGAHNTDGFDIGGTQRLTIDGANVENQDDCVAVNSGSDLTFTNMNCKGSHGLSIAVGNGHDNTVKNVLFSNSVVRDSTNGLRIKTVKGGQGSISNVKFRDITLSGITQYGIDIEQNYSNSGSSGDPTNGVKISGVSFENVKGSVVGNGQPWHILCGKGSCEAFSKSGVSIQSSNGARSTCVNSPAKMCD